MKEINNRVNGSKIFNVNVLDKLILSLGVLISTMAINNVLASVFTIFFIGYLNISLSRIGVRSYLLICLIPVGFLALSLISIIIQFNSSEYIAYFNIYWIKVGVTYSGVLEGITIATRSLASITCLYFILLNTSIHDLIGFLRRCRLPIILVNLIEMIYRFIFILIDEVGRVYTSVLCRGGNRGGFNNIKLFSKALGRVITLGLSRVERIDNGLNSRGYSGSVYYLNRETSHSIGLNILTVFIIAVQIGLSMV
ncbi:MAG: cobalt ECF transporter T component CbiQ [Clostridium sp.]